MHELDYLPQPQKESGQSMADLLTEWAKSQSEIFSNQQNLLKQNDENYFNNAQYVELQQAIFALNGIIESLSYREEINTNGVLILDEKMSLDQENLNLRNVVEIYKKISKKLLHYANNIADMAYEGSATTPMVNFGSFSFIRVVTTMHDNRLVFALEPKLHTLENVIKNNNIEQTPEEKAKTIADFIKKEIDFSLSEDNMSYY